MAACRRISCFTKRGQTYLYKYSAFYSTNTASKSETGNHEIVIPYRIERGPTDILKALSSTIISKDYTAPHYKYEDDPYFIPSSNVTKRAFALSKESGKKAARYFLEKYPEYFKCNTSAPHIKAFDPPIIYTEDNVSDVSTLKYCIAEFELDNSVTIYKILKKKGINVSQEIKQDLLDLLCFYNSVQSPSEEYYEERFFSRNEKQPLERWNPKGMANELFEEMEKDGRAYSSMICGTSKFFSPDRALALYDEMQHKNLVGTVEAYNNLISIIYLLKEDDATRWEFAMRLLGTMNAEGLRPNLYTMNSLLELLSKCSRWKKSTELTLRVLAEMRKLKIEPSLGTYYYMLLIFFSNDFSNLSLLYEIMKEIENKEHEIMHPADVNFFNTFMEVCWKGSKDKDLAYRLHNVLEFKKNSKLLGTALSESHYFKCFFRLLCETEDMDKFMEIYEKYVPNTYTPEPSVTLTVIETIHFTGAYKHLPRLLSDMLFFEQTERENILSLAMEAAGCMKHEEKTQEDIMNMVWNIFEKLRIRGEGTRRLPFDWTGVLLGNILQTFLNGKDIKKAHSVVKKLKDEEQSIVGFPDKKILLKYCELCLQKAQYDEVMFCMKYAVNSCYLDFRNDIENLIQDMFEQNKLEEKQRAQVNSLFQSSSNVADTSSSESSSSDSSSSDTDSASSDEEEEKDNKQV